MNLIVQAAIRARKNAFAPYSKHTVGAALEASDGSIITGCNVESSSYGLTTCAERTAICSAIAQGHRSFKQIVVVSEKGVSPCGACRQIIWDICGDIPVVLVSGRKIKRQLNLRDLLPYPFDRKFLKQ